MDISSEYNKKNEHGFDLGMKKNEQSLIFSALAVLLFILVAAIFPFKDQIFKKIYPKPPSNAASSIMRIAVRVPDQQSFDELENWRNGTKGNIPFIFYGPDSLIENNSVTATSVPNPAELAVLVNCDYSATSQLSPAKIAELIRYNITYIIQDCEKGPDGWAIPNIDTIAQSIAPIINDTSPSGHDFRWQMGMQFGLLENNDTGMICSDVTDMNSTCKISDSYGGQAWTYYNSNDVMSMFGQAGSQSTGQEYHDANIYWVNWINSHYPNNSWWGLGDLQTKRDSSGKLIFVNTPCDVFDVAKMAMSMGAKGFPVVFLGKNYDAMFNVPPAQGDPTDMGGFLTLWNTYISGLSNPTPTPIACTTNPTVTPTNSPNPTRTPTPTPTTSGNTVSGKLYTDANQNKTLDTGETGVSGTTISLITLSGGNPVSTLTTTTDSSGNYSFVNVASGNTYQVAVTPPNNYITTTPSVYQLNNLSGDQTNNFGINTYTPPTINSYKPVVEIISTLYQSLAGLLKPGDQVQGVVIRSSADTALSCTDNKYTTVIGQLNAIPASSGIVKQLVVSSYADLQTFLNCLAPNTLPIDVSIIDYDFEGGVTPSTEFNNTVSSVQTFASIVHQSGRKMRWGPAHNQYDNLTTSQKTTVLNSIDILGYQAQKILPGDGDLAFIPEMKNIYNEVKQLSSNKAQLHLQLWVGEPGSSLSLITEAFNQLQSTQALDIAAIGGGSSSETQTIMNGLAWRSATIASPTPTTAVPTLTPTRTPTPTPSRTPTPTLVPIQGDVNGDRVVNLIDLSVMLSNFNKTVIGSNRAADLNSDNAINSLDFSVLLPILRNAGVIS